MIEGMKGGREAGSMGSTLFTGIKISKEAGREADYSEEENE